MSNNVSKKPGNVTVTISNPTTPAIYNVAMPLANTGYSQLLPTNTKKILIKTRDIGSYLLISWLVSFAEYILLAPGQSKEVDGVNLSGITIYFQSPDPGNTVEIEVWT